VTRIEAQGRPPLEVPWGWLGRAARRSRETFGATARKGTVALVDQAVVSGTRFFTTVVVGRMCGPDELGIYSLGFTIVVLIGCVQESLIAVPYTIYGNRLQGARRAEYAGAAVAQYALLSALAVACLAVAGGVLSTALGPGRLTPVIWVLAGMIPFMLLWEFGRRLAFAHLDVVKALALDLALAAIQIGGLVWLAAGAKLSAVTAHTMVGLACAVVGIVWFALARKSLAVRWQRVPRQWRRNWLLGRWVFASRMTSVLHGYSVYWLLALTLGAAGTGEYAACMTIILLANPFLLGISNVLGPRAARAFAEGGRREARRVVWKVALLLAFPMAVFCGLVVLFGDEVLCLLYGSRYAGHHETLAVLAVAVLIHALCIAVDHGLCVMERPDVNFKAGLLGLTVTLVLAVALVGPYGILGAAWGMLAGGIAVAAVQSTVFIRLVGGPCRAGRLQGGSVQTTG